MTVKKRGARWYYNFSIKGRRYIKALPEVSKKSEAITKEAEARQAVHNGTYDKPAVVTPTFAAFVESNFMPYSRANKRTHYDDGITTKTMCAFFGAMLIDEITAADVERYKQERYAGLTKSKEAPRRSTVNLRRYQKSFRSHLMPN